MHWPPEHVPPIGQVFPQLPQFAVVSRGVHTLWQSPHPAGHEQAPLWQLPPVGQVCPQLPQFFGSLLRFLHTPEQLLVPAGQQMPPLLLVPVRQQIPPLQ